MNYYFNCPRCNNNEEFCFPEEESGGMGCALLLFGGLIPAFIYADSLARRVQCGKCGYIFQQPRMPKSTISKFTFWILALVLIFIIVVILFSIAPYLNDLIPKHEIVSLMESFVSENSKVIAVATPIFLALLTLICFIVSGVSNFRSNQKLKMKYKTKPTYRQLSDGKLLNELNEK